MDSLEDIATLITNLTTFRVLSMVIGTPFFIGTIVEIVAWLIGLVVLPHVLSQIDFVDKVPVTFVTSVRRCVSTLSSFLPVFLISLHTRVAWGQVGCLLVRFKVVLAVGLVATVFTGPASILVMRFDMFIEGFFVVKLLFAQLAVQFWFCLALRINFPKSLVLSPGKI